MTRLALIVAALAQLALGGEFDRAWLHDSLARVHPRLRSRWLNQRDIELPGYFESRAPESDGIRMTGKWGRGPSYEVTGRDSLVFLSLGSEVAIINLADPDNPEVLSEPQAMGLVTQAAVRDSFLYIGTFTGAAGIEIWNIADPRSPVFRNRILTRLTDFCIRDSFAFVTQRSSPSTDTFKVYTLADPANPRLVGACRDSGQAITVTGNTVILGDWNDLHALDVSDPANPHRVGQYPGFALSVAARGNICCAAFNWNTETDHFRFEVLDISNPATMRRLGFLDSIGGYDIHLDRSLAYVSGFSDDHEFAIVSISDSGSPAVLGRLATTGWSFGVWADSLRAKAFVADHWEGLAVVGTADPGAPVTDTIFLQADAARDISVWGVTACIAQYMAGLKLLDVSNSVQPVEISALDTTGQRPFAGAVAFCDSFAYVAWSSPPTFRTVAVAEPTRPSFVGGCSPGNPMDIVLRDTFAYVAAARLFSIVNIARPREPALVGSCTIGDLTGCGLALWDTLAYINAIPGLWIVSIADPSAPRVIDTAGGRRLNAWGIAVRETLAFIPSFYDTMWIVSVADPRELRYLAGVPLGIDNWGYDAVVVEDTLVYVATLNEVILVNVKSPAFPAIVARCPTPYAARRVVYDEPYVCVACNEAGVLILDTVTTGVTEGSLPLPAREVIRLEPSLTHGMASLVLPPGQRVGPVRVAVRDVAGRLQPAVGLRSTGSAVTIDVGELPPGVYFVELSGDRTRAVFRLVKI
jgi:hypothetical protein